MEAKELREGNLININGKEKAVTALEIAVFNYDSLEIKPITLTEEWFVEFGAKLKKVAGMDNEYNLKLGEVEISWDKKTGVTVFVLDTLESFRVSYIKYVHQFQNFCFALTNEELTIKE